MGKKGWVLLALILVVPGLLFTTACSKKAVKEAAPEAEATVDDDAAAREAAEKARQAELARQKALEEERLREEAAVREKFVNEHVYFAFDSAVLDMMAQDVLKNKGMWLKGNPDVNVTIEGHCDERGTVEYNLALGDRRAESTKAYLVNLGIPASRIETVSYGEERPVDPGQNEAAWARNRRAAFVIR
jgi:peptidoglycan-associated lipoprotein